MDIQWVSLPYEFTLFSNPKSASFQVFQFHYLMNLHYSQTKLLNPEKEFTFHYLMNLHYSQTVHCRLANSR